MDRNVAIFCLAADRVAANALAETKGAGPNSFSVPLSTSPGVSDPALATHWAGSGYIPEEAVAALETSVAPMIQVRSNDGKDFAQHLAESTPVLYRIYEAL